MKKHYDYSLIGIIISFVGIIAVADACYKYYYSNLNLFIEGILFGIILIWYFCYNLFFYIQDKLSAPKSKKDRNLFKYIGKKLETIKLNIKKYLSDDYIKSLDKDTARKIISRMDWIFIATGFSLNYLLDYCIENDYPILVVILIPITLIYAYVGLYLLFYGYTPKNTKYNGSFLAGDDSSIKAYARRNGVLDEFNVFGDYFLGNMFGDDF